MKHSIMCNKTNKALIKVITLISGFQFCDFMFVYMVMEENL